MIFILYNIYLNLSGVRTWRVLHCWTWKYFALEIVFGIRSRADSAFFHLIFILLRTLICNHFEFEGSTSFKSNGHDQGWGKFFTGCFWRKEILPRKSRDRRNPIQAFFISNIIWTMGFLSAISSSNSSISAVVQSKLNCLTNDFEVILNDVFISLICINYFSII